MKRSDSILLNFYRGKLPKYQQRGLIPMYTNTSDFNTNMGIPSRSQIEKQYQMLLLQKEYEKQQAQQLAQQQAKRRQTFIGPADTRVSTKIIQREMADQRLRQEAQQRSALAQTFGSFTPTGSPAAGAIGAEMFVNMNPITGPAMSAGRLTQQAIGQDPYGFDNPNNPWYMKGLGALGLVGDVFGLGMLKGMKVSSSAPLSSQMSSRLNQQLIRPTTPFVRQATSIPKTPIAKNLYETVDPETGVSTFDESPIAQRQMIAQQESSTPSVIYGRDDRGIFSESNGVRRYELLPPAEEIILGEPIRKSLLNITEADYNTVVNRLRNIPENSIGRVQGASGFSEPLRILRDMGYDVGGMSSSQQIRDMARTLSQNINTGTNFNDALRSTIQSYIITPPAGTWGTMPTSYLSDLTYNPNAWTNRSGILGKLKSRIGDFDYELGDLYRSLRSKKPPAFDAKKVLDEINEELVKGVGVKKTNLPLRVELGPTNQSSNDFYLRTFVDDKLAGDINLVRNIAAYTGGPRQKLSEILLGNSDLNNARSRWLNTPGFQKRGDYPLSYLRGVNLENQGISGEFNKAINEVLKRRGLGNITSGGTGHSALGKERWENLVKRGFAEFLGDQYYILKKQGGPVVNPRGYMDGQPPRGSNWRIPGNGAGTSITMDLPNMPDEILVVPDGDFDQAKVMKRGEEEYFAGADFVDEYSMKGGGLTPNKAREILHHGEVHGNPLTEKQRRFFGAMSKGHTKKYQSGGNPLLIKKQKDILSQIADLGNQRQEQFAKTYGNRDVFLEHSHDPNNKLKIFDANKFGSWSNNPTYKNELLNLTSGRFRGASVPKSVITDLVRASKQQGVDPWIMVSILGRESTFGSGSLANRERSSSRATLISGWNVMEDYEPYRLERFLADKKVPGIKTLKNIHGWDYRYDDIEKTKKYLNAHPEIMQAYKTKLDKTPSVGDMNAFDLAAKFVKEKGIRRYNFGDRSYYDDVMKDMQLLKNDPSMKQYMKSLGYKDGGGYGVFGYTGKGWYKNGGQHGGLDRWFAEKWVDVKSGKPCGRQEGESRAYPACRPSRRVSSKTPKTSGEMSSAEKAKFKSSKTSSQRIPYNHKRR